MVAVIERAVDALMGEARRIVARRRRARDALTALLHAHVDFAMTETALITVYDQEAHNLDEAARRRLRRQQRPYTELWIDVLALAAPGAAAGRAQHRGSWRLRAPQLRRGPPTPPR